MGTAELFAHFDGVVIDWRYLQVRKREELAQEAGWVGQQGLSVVVDLTSGINLFPDLRLLNNLRQDHAASLAAIEDVIAKMEILPARDLVMSLHRYPETNFSEEQAWQSFEATLRQVSERARRREVTVHLRLSLNKPPETSRKLSNLPAAWARRTCGSRPARRFYSPARRASTKISPCSKAKWVYG